MRNRNDKEKLIHIRRKETAEYNHIINGFNKHTQTISPFSAGNNNSNNNNYCYVMNSASLVSLGYACTVPIT